MAINYKLYQDNREKSLTRGKWYARAAYNQTVDTEGLIALIEKVCTVSDADVVAVMKAMQFVIKQQLDAGNKVHLTGLGTFYVSLQTKPANSAKEFTAAQNIVGSRLKFMAELKKLAQSGTRYSPLIMDVTYKEQGDYHVNKE